MDEPDKHREIFFKILGGVFAAIIAPILTGSVLYYIQKRLDDPKPDGPDRNVKAEAAAVSNGSVSSKAAPRYETADRDKARPDTIRQGSASRRCDAFHSPAVAQEKTAASSATV
jgi:hypothetical protein